ncbi:MULTISPECIES: AMP-binding protein [unclassified Variovorax]|uniref:AMP-binding protein n=1 Tax=unclassified Variovorax TaxID=663243 RepID=UPI00076DCE23|nr:MULTISPECIES: AMP-binding protein [unclassified Variovorax]KWT96823.1 Long-chain-fatty-acid--CoA ligase [Variovorax sp. WDL1]PNG47194.1 Long-chain-fatty-acid--CoA ligase [Variovorax sp. B2]PNG48155.1 Long-chain-fatty-acid--CoA ligase [Variovorax sp. B4]VTV15074.1 Long-chain-fatty-acid--CoA ligase [Variovorax sp. WDL1]
MTALDNGRRTWSAADLDTAAHSLAQKLTAQGTRVLATLMDNTPAWVVADLACAQAHVVHVPLPLFFSAEQLSHVLGTAGVDTLLTLGALAARWPSAPACAIDIADEPLVMMRLPFRAPPMPPGTTKITFTSGTTGVPKGVCLSAGSMQSVANGLVQALDPLDIQRHLCALPFAVLLENIAGLMAPLARGATCIVLPLKELGLQGSSSFDAARFHATVLRHQPNSIILLPQMLQAWVHHLLEARGRAPASLRMVAVGGAAVGSRLMAAARSVGLPAYEGYGLSEGASVQTLNLPGAERDGSAGRALPHARLRIAADGEIEIAGSLFSGYLGDPAPAPAWWPTGDLGSIDDDGFVYVRGRKKLVLITSFGRNVSPEWIETQLRDESAIGQAVVLGDGQAALGSVLWPLRAETTDADLQAAVDAANTRLPDYARVHRWTRGRAAFDAASGMATPNGRPQRAAILAAHADALGIPST